jgi:hypothetical protein
LLVIARFQKYLIEFNLNPKECTFQRESSSI